MCLLLLSSKNKQTNKQTKHTQACWIVNNELKGSEVPAQFSSFPSNRLCLTPKFCINYDYKILAGGLHHPTTFENNNSCKIWEGKQSKKKTEGNGNDLLYCFLFVPWWSPPQEFVTSSLPDRLKISLTPTVGKKQQLNMWGVPCWRL